MQMDSFVASMGGVERQTQVQTQKQTQVQTASKADSAAGIDGTLPAADIQSAKDLTAIGTEQENQQGQQRKEKEPAESSMKDALAKLNAQIASTHCAYSYDKETHRISIKVFDDNTDELIREIPPEKSLEALKKMWEIAGIMIDEKR